MDRSGEAERKRKSSGEADREHKRAWSTVSGWTVYWSIENRLETWFRDHPPIETGLEGLFRNVIIFAHVFPVDSHEHGFVG